MEGIEDETQLKEQIVVTGAEVHSFSLLPYVRVIHPFLFNKINHKCLNKRVHTLAQAGVDNCIWADCFAIGVVAR